MSDVPAPVEVRVEVVSDDGVTRVEDVYDVATGHKIGTNVIALEAEV